MAQAISRSLPPALFARDSPQRPTGAALSDAKSALAPAELSPPRDPHSPAAPASAPTAPAPPPQSPHHAPGTSTTPPTASGPRPRSPTAAPGRCPSQTAADTTDSSRSEADVATSPRPAR